LLRTEYIHTESSAFITEETKIGLFKLEFESKPVEIRSNSNHSHYTEKSATGNSECKNPNSSIA